MIKQKVNDVELLLATDEIIFSPKAVDRGTLSMLSLIDFKPEDKVLDLGCGYGVVGILAAKIIGGERVIMCDISPIAVKLARENAELNHVGSISILESDGLEGILDNDFTLILSNPPYHADFSVAKRFIEDGFKKLVVGGKLVMVTKRKEWYKKKLTAVFGGVKIVEREGYYVFIAQKRYSYVRRKEKQIHKLSAKLQRKEEKRKSRKFINIC